MQHECLDGLCTRHGEVLAYHQDVLYTLCTLSDSNYVQYQNPANVFLLFVIVRVLLMI